MIPIIHCLLFDGLAFMVRIDLPVDWEHYKYIAYSVNKIRLLSNFQLNPSIFDNVMTIFVCYFDPVGAIVIGDQ